MLRTMRSNEVAADISAPAPTWKEAARWVVLARFHRRS